MLEKSDHSLTLDGEDTTAQLFSTINICRYGLASETYKDMGIFPTFVVPDLDRNVLHEDTVTAWIITTGRALCIVIQLVIGWDEAFGSSTNSVCDARKAVLVSFCEIGLNHFDDVFETRKTAVCFGRVIAIAYPDAAILAKGRALEIIV